MATYLLVVASIWLIFLISSVLSITSNQKCLKAEFDYGRQFVWIQPLHHVYDDLAITSATLLAQGTYFNDVGWSGGILTGFEDTDTETIIFTNNDQDSQLELILAHDASCSPGGTEYCRGGSNHSHIKGCSKPCDNDGALLRLDIEVLACSGGNCNTALSQNIKINYAAGNVSRFDNDSIIDYSKTCSNFTVGGPGDSYLWSNIETKGTFTAAKMAASGNKGMVLGSFPILTDWCMNMEYSYLWSYSGTSLSSPGIKFFSFLTEKQTEKITKTKPPLLGLV